MVQKSFVRRFENDTFESVFLKSVEMESVVVSAHWLECNVNKVFLHFSQNKTSQKQKIQNSVTSQITYSITIATATCQKILMHFPI